MTSAVPAVAAGPLARPWFTLAVYAWAAVLLSLHATLSIAALPLTLSFDQDRRFAAGLASWLTRTALRCPSRWRGAAQGLDLLGAARGEGPAVIVMNHRSIADIAIAVAVPGGPKIVSKPWAAELPLVGLCMRLCGHLVFDPRSPAGVRELIRRAESLLARGNSVLFFPEGTRRTSSGVGVFQEGAFHLAVRMQVDVLPVVLHATGDLVPKGSFTFHDVPVDVTPLARIAPGNDRSDLARRVQAAMSASLAAHD